MKACPNAAVPDYITRRPMVWLVLAGIGLMAACTDVPSDEGAFPVDGPFPPTALASDGAAVDGVLVGNRLMQAGEYELALRAFFRAGAEQGMTAEILSGIGSANLKLGRLNQSETLLRRAVEEYPDYVPGWNNLGVLLMEKGDYGEASRVFRQAFALDSGNSDDIRNNLSLALEKRDALRYSQPSENKEFDLAWQGNGSYALISP